MPLSREIESFEEVVEVSNVGEEGAIESIGGEVEVGKVSNLGRQGARVCIVGDVKGDERGDSEEGERDGFGEVVITEEEVMEGVEEAEIERDIAREGSIEEEDGDKAEDDARNTGLGVSYGIGFVSLGKGENEVRGNGRFESEEGEVIGV